MNTTMNTEPNPLDTDALLGDDAFFAEVCDARRDAWMAAVDADPDAETLYG